MRVLKFGGTSVGTIESFRDVVKIISQKFKEDKTVVVVSALAKVTDQLINAVELAGKRNQEYKKIFGKIKSRHYNFIHELVSEKLQIETKIRIDAILNELELKLESIFFLQEYSARVSDSIISVGERLSQEILSSALNSSGIKSIVIDAGKLIRTNDNFGQAEVDYNTTDKLLAKSFRESKRDCIQVLNGFTGTTTKGEPTTLGRSGSDYTATIVGSALNADVIEIWTDVDGILTADPRLVSDAIPLKTLSYQDAAELAFLGAKVVFPKAMEPVKFKNIPVLVLNTFQPEFEGTLINHEPEGNPYAIKSVTHMEDLSLITLSNIALDSDTHLLERIVRVLKHQKWPSIFFNYSISQRSISVLTNTKKSVGLVEEIRDKLKIELETKMIGNINLRNSLCLVSVIGNNSDYQVETMNKIFRTIEANHFKNILFFSCSEGRNHSFLFAEAEAGKVVNAIHDTFLNEFINTNVA